jgi:hypothetical protein
MGWTIDLTANKKIDEEDICSIVKDLPKSLQSLFGTSEQQWGWSCRVDIYKPVGKTLTLHGAGFSCTYGEPMARYIEMEMREKGYYVEIGEMSW